MSQDDRPTSRRAGRGLRLIAALLCVALASAGCDDDEMTGAPCLDFNPFAVPDPLTVTAAEGLGSTCDVAVVDLIVTDVSNLYAASFDVNYDATRVSLVTVATTNSALGSDGAPLLRQVTQVGTGQIHVAITRSLPATMGVDVVGGATLATLTFLRAGTSGMTAMTFTDADLLDPSTPPQPLPGILFSGGSFAIFTN